MYKNIVINNFRMFNEHSILLGKKLTIISGRNSTGKTTILGMLANSGELKRKDGTTYLSKLFRADFNDLFKASQVFDKAGPNKFSIKIFDYSSDCEDERSFRVAWQRKDKSKNDDIHSKPDSRERFRLIPTKYFSKNKKTETKFTYPIIYLGLSRLFPIGESSGDLISTKSLIFLDEEHKQWFTDNYKFILSMQANLDDVMTYNIGEIKKKNGIGVCTSVYDYLTNSSGEDNLGQILLSLLSFRNLKEQYVQKDIKWKGGVLLIDEIESSLHPAAQNRLIDLMISESRNYNFQIVFTTHSLSLIRYVCEKIEKNNSNENINNDIEFYYLTNANRKLEIKRNLLFDEISNELLVTSTVSNIKKIKIYTEDAESRWFLNYLLKNYITNIDLFDNNIGCDELAKLMIADYEYFKNKIIIYDGDVSDELITQIKSKVTKYYNNILKLPTNGDSLEKFLYKYIINLDKDHPFWSELSFQDGFTWQYFNDNKPYTEGDKTERVQYKEWFRQHQNKFDSLKLINFWMTENESVVKEFITNFINCYNFIANSSLYPRIYQ